jgi:hypothetical protein
MDSSSTVPLQRIDRPVRPPMPSSVRLAIALIGLQVLVALFDLQRSWSGLQAASVPALVRYSVLVGAVGGQALTIGLIAGMVWRKHWARMAWLILTLISLAMLFISHVGERPAAQVMLANGLLVAGVLASYLLFSASARPWFRRDEPAHE